NTQNNEQQQSQATDNAKAENNTQALPETGEESSNTTLVTMIASVILAAGSLLAFRRTSKSNK
ncbi:LPXTG cell wall anchor domain-containing protein, partial [Staphylococcus epidermidis]|nr:LPXTG cell wall anchor domain-containing protein [Staphylococcus epidermidis]